MKDNLGIYIHIPYCHSKCNYCGFLSVPTKAPEIPASYLDLLCREIALYGKTLKEGGNGHSVTTVDTVFFGGGTPSLLLPKQVDRILTAIKACFPVAADAEITLEGNPESFTMEHLAGYRELGVNRISMGLQAVQDPLLASLGRIHTYRNFVTAYETATDCGFTNINVDLMFALPRQDRAMWSESLHTVAGLPNKPTHISAYSLQLEEGTILYEAYKKGLVSLPDDATERAMHEDAMDILAEAGYTHYEISNFALPGFACRHNEKYWQMDDFLGLGVGAASYLLSRRFENHKTIPLWEKTIEEERTAFYQATEESTADAMSIFCFTSLRTRKGLDLKAFDERFGISLEGAYEGQPLPLEDWIKAGLMTCEGDILRLTKKGIASSNDIMASFIL